MTSNGPIPMSVAPRDTARILQSSNNLSGIVDWQDLFGNDRQVEIEVGSGKGLFLLSAGSERPETNFLGIEITRKYATLSATRAARHSLPNVRVLIADARRFFSRHVASESVQAVHVYFPDPWWKRRHKKRRVLNETFLGDVERVLIAGGLLHVWTDVEEYFETTRAILGKQAGLCLIDPPEQREPEHDMDYRTNFERKMRRSGRPIFRALISKRGAKGGQGVDPS